MVWKHVLFPKPSIYPHKVEALRAIGSFSSSISCLIGNTQMFYSSKNPSSQRGDAFKKAGFCLTPHVVHSTLASCSSDLVALSFFMWCARQPNYFHDRLAFGHMVNVAARLAQKFVSVKEIVRQLESIGCVTKAQIFLVLLRIFWQGKLYSLVFDVCEEMNRLSYTANTFVYNVIIDVSFKIGRMDMALGVLRDIKVSNFLSYKIAVCNLCKLNNMENMQAVLQIMLRAGYYPDAKTFVMVVHSFCKKGRIEVSFQALGLMICLGIPVSVAFWNILIDGLCRIGRPAAATSTIHKMISIGCSPNLVTYTSLVKAFMDYEMVDDAFRILTMMENNGCEGDVVLYNMLIHRLSKIGRYDEALYIFFLLRKRSVEPDSYTFCSLLCALQRSGKFHLLPKMFKGVAFPADLVACNSFLSYLCKAGLHTSAVAFFHEMVHRGYIPDKYSYAGLLDGLCRAGKIDDAVSLYQAMVMGHLDIDAYVHTVIIYGLIKVGKYHLAINLFTHVLREVNELDIILCSVAIEAFVRDGRIQDALTLYSKMKDCGVSPNTCAYNLMLFGLCKVGDVHMLKAVLHHMHDEGIDLDSRTCIRITNLVFKSKYCPSVFGLLIKMWASGLIADSVMHKFLLEGYSQGIMAGDACSLLKGYLGAKSFMETSRSDRYSFVEISSSDELSDMVASVG